MVRSLERLLKKRLLKLACRYHVYELILRSVFELKFGETTGPNVSLFMEFQEKWDKIDQTKYKPWYTRFYCKENFK